MPTASCNRNRLNYKGIRGTLTGGPQDRADLKVHTAALAGAMGHGTFPAACESDRPLGRPQASRSTEIGFV